MFNIKNIILESYQDIQGLNSLAKEILIYVGENNVNILYDLYKNQYKFENLKKEIELDKDLFYLKSVVNKKNKLSLNSFINNMDLQIYFDNVDFGQNDALYDKKNNLIRIYTNRDEFYETLQDYEIDIKNLNISSIMQMYNMMNKILEESFKDIIVHELQHAYDDFRTDGKFVRHKKTQDFFKMIQNRTDKDLKNKEEYIKYLNLPHELWGRFAQTVSNFNENDWSEDFILILKGFRNGFEGYEYLNDKDKKRLIKALYKLHDINK